MRNVIAQQNTKEREVVDKKVENYLKELKY